ncbi:MAG TPA: rod shape-determining protein MreD [Acidimicrobiales bacterium]|nr:rod shape-determining protein MreD [Acidimicrobiales bacterium]
MEPPVTPRRHRIAAVLLLTLVLHLTVLSRLTLDGVRPDALLLVTALAGLASGPERGAVTGFVAGVLADLFLPTPFGLSALTYCLVGFCVGLVQSGILRAAWWIPVATALVASAAGTVLFGVLGAMVGQVEFVSPRLAVVAAVAGVMNAALAPGASRLVNWSYRSGTVDRPLAA